MYTCNMSIVMHVQYFKCVISPVNVVELGEFSLHPLDVVNLGFTGGPRCGVVQGGLRRLPAYPGTGERVRRLVCLKKSNKNKLILTKVFYIKMKILGTIILSM